MNAARTFEVARLDAMHSLRRPMYWIEIVILALFLMALASGHGSIGSGDSRVGGTKAWINSEFAITQLVILLVSVIHVFFISVGAGMSLIRDDELKVGEVLHATRLTPGEYVWGKYLAVLASFTGVLVAQSMLQMFFIHVMPHGANADYIGPFRLAAYVRPLLVFGLPAIVFYTGACFAIGSLSRQPVLVFALPIAILMLGLSLLWDWSPVWLPQAANRALMFVDFTGLRWLNETYLKADRGVDFYNRSPVVLDALMLAQRLLTALAGLGAVVLVQNRLRGRLRGANARGADLARAAAAPPAAAAALPLAPAPVAALGMTSDAPGFLASVRHVAATEIKLLGRHPGLYLFVPLILIQVLGGVVQTGAFDTPMLWTSGTMAVADMNTLTLLICFLILFYTTESLQREGVAGFGPIAYATPVRTAAMLAGKALANAVLGVAVVAAALVGSAIVLLVQGKVGFDPWPFALVWGGLLLPTFLFWTAFVSAAYAVTNNRYGTYAIGLAAMSATGWFQVRGKMSWVWNWDLWGATRWTDIATFQLDGLTLLLNRLMVLGAAAFFVVLTVRTFARRERDATRDVQRLRPGSVLRGALALAPWALVPLALAITLGVQVAHGWQGEAARKQERDYWKKNALTWRDAPLPAIAGADVDIVIEPATHHVRSRGTYRLVNHTGALLDAIPVSSGLEWKHVAWSLDGDSARPEDRAGLFVFHLARPLAPDSSVRLGWSFDALVPLGTSKNGAGTMEFALPSSVVLTAFGSANLGPYLGWQPDVGVEPNKNAADPREYPDDFYKGVTPAGLSMAENWFDTHLRVTVPADLEVNATGVCTSDVVHGATRVTEWRSDHPVRIWNVCAGRWKVRRGEGVALYYDARHAYNVEEMYRALAGARRWYGTWFGAFPWHELRLSEFAGLAGYAQGSPGNITFSETIGFLTRSRPEGNAPFWVTAHESAHQWWPNIAMSGRGPGGDVLSEGMAHFSTILLTEQVLGPEQRMAFCREIERSYARSRQRNSERPLVKVDGAMPADQRIIYDKGGWALWMLFQVMGRDAGLAGVRDYLETYRDSRDHPVLQDYLAVLRRHAPDTTAFDSCAVQWFHRVVTPQYEIRDERVTRDGAGWVVRASVHNAGTGRMPIEVAAARGERFPHGKSKPAPYRDARTTLVLGAGERRAIEIRCPFVPERLVVDPDVRVLQAERDKAEAKLAVKGGATVS